MDLLLIELDSEGRLELASSVALPGSASKSISRLYAVGDTVPDVSSWNVRSVDINPRGQMASVTQTALDFVSNFTVMAPGWDFLAIASSGSTEVGLFHPNVDETVTANNRVTLSGVTNVAFTP
jgi:hypothetical protein